MQKIIESNNLTTTSTSRSKNISIDTMSTFDDINETNNESNNKRNNESNLSNIALNEELTAQNKKLETKVSHSMLEGKVE